MIVVNESMSQSDAELDLALAAELQAALLPQLCPPACRNFRAAALNRMCGSVGGDFYDFMALNDDQTAWVIGDVVGHGVRASLLMARIMGFLRTNSGERSRPKQMVTALNEMLLDLGDRTGSVMCCSMIYAVMDAPSGLALFINAGHPMPLLCDRKRCATLHLGPRNILLGVQDFQPQEACHTFSPGERLVLYTDGVIDATNADGQRFEQRRLHEVIVGHTEADPERCARGVFQAVEDFRQASRQSDDETILIVDRI
jgi:sigma-B regulation protein RsbU (phosphoserine phosphatase)